ncbi:hypothetical protein J8273_6057 [Carpediemonas membranifera]|uniref:ER membrane protein complex subunit 7 beta-sandwich domain-containing protein n=1 Tax=Carpediemonas membranifera TaxID=201153 RepID=A0A8J6DYQ0_9EUKA|nr:hypothetical protein J8273_6057 [Carpediemonas membranifera]|eukprot:KAG9392589.1 hypothetical protein J8273_6057 [Carpediemonas membranifera]
MMSFLRGIVLLSLLSAVLCVSFDMNISKPARTCGVTLVDDAGTQIIPVTSTGQVRFPSLSEGRSYVYISCDTEVYPTYVLLATGDEVSLSRMLPSGKLKTIANPTGPIRPSNQFRFHNYTPEVGPSLVDKLKGNKKMLIMAGVFGFMFITSRMSKNIAPAAPTTGEAKPTADRTNLSLKDVFEAPAGPQGGGFMGQMKAMVEEQKKMIEAQQESAAKKSN